MSAGIIGGEPLLDLCYEEDSRAEVDMNIVLTGAGQFVELQATAEKNQFDDHQLSRLLELGRHGIAEAAHAARHRLAPTSKYVIFERLLSMRASSVPHSNARRAETIYKAVAAELRAWRRRRATDEGAGAAKALGAGSVVVIGHGAVGGA